MKRFLLDVYYTCKFTAVCCAVIGLYFAIRVFIMG